MDPTARSRAFVDDALDRLRADDGEFPLETVTWHVDAADHDAYVERLRAGALGGAGTWTRNDAGEVLLVRNERDAAWADPGGKREAGESFATAARCETREETGIDPEIEGVAVAQRIRVTAPDRDPLQSLVVVFHATGNGAPSPREDEIAAARWWPRRPDDLLYDALERLPFPGERSPGP
ncbi:MAG: NUDIX hydrolase [Haloarculaceae archaeon]